MRTSKLLETDLEEIQEIFPKLKYFIKDDLRAVRGEIDICDCEGNYWETFKIAVVIPKNYPFGVPQLLELSKIIERDKDRHISEEGLCCVDMDHELLVQSKKGIKLLDFIKNQVYPFLCNQLYFDLESEYANGEYQHYFDGVRQFYSRRLRLDDPALIVKILQLVLANKVPKRNVICPCGKDKIKKCHEKEINFLKSVGAQKLKKDLIEFQKLI